jgi:hypothetical protein
MGTLGFGKRVGYFIIIFYLLGNLVRSSRRIKLQDSPVKGVDIGGLQFRPEHTHVFVASSREKVDHIWHLNGSYFRSVLS